MTLVKIATIVAVAWIGTAWPAAWSGLIMLTSLSALSLGLAADLYNRQIERYPG